jgi:SIR2-like domain
MLFWPSSGCRCTLPLYLTTNYDGFMTKALEIAGASPSREACRWAGDGADDVPMLFDSAQGFDPTPEAPVVYHLHGHLDDLDSLVLTEDDYLDFLVSISRRPELIPPRIHEALAGSSLLFIGYQLADWDFRVLFRWIVEAIDRSDRYLNLTVQIPREGDPARVDAIHRYLDDYFDEMKVQTYWGSAREFAAELRTRWRAFRGPDGNP